MLGATIALAGLLLIFSGFLYGQAAIMPAATDDKLINTYKNVARFALIPFVGSILLASASATWFMICASWLTSVIFFGFIVLSLATIIYGIVAATFL
jgi:hypothetical protein